MNIKSGDKVLLRPLPRNLAAVRLQPSNIANRTRKVILHEQLANGHYLAVTKEGAGDIIEIAREDIIKVIETKEEIMKSLYKCKLDDKTDYSNIKEKLHRLLDSVAIDIQHSIELIETIEEKAHMAFSERGIYTNLKQNINYDKNIRDCECQ